VPQYWGIQWSVAGDLRFGSQRDMMRVMERTITRADLPVRYSQGFNPHPRFSLPCPRPVAIASRHELLVLILDSPIDPKATLEKLNARSPEGLRFLSARQLPGSRIPRPLRIHYELPVESAAVGAILARLEDLEHRKTWLVKRRRTGGGRSGQRRSSPSTRTIDLKPLTERMSLDKNILHIVLVRDGDCWARPSEILELIGLDPRTDLSRTIRTKVEYEMQSPL